MTRGTCNSIIQIHMLRRYTSSCSVADFSTACFLWIQVGISKWDCMYSCHTKHAACYISLWGGNGPLGAFKPCLRGNSVIFHCFLWKHSGTLLTESDWMWLWDIFCWAGVRPLESELGKRHCMVSGKEMVCETMCLDIPLAGQNCKFLIPEMIPDMFWLRKDILFLRGIVLTVEVLNKYCFCVFLRLDSQLISAWWVQRNIHKAATQDLMLWVLKLWQVIRLCPVHSLLL